MTRRRAPKQRMYERVSMEISTIHGGFRQLETGGTGPWAGGKNTSLGT